VNAPPILCVSANPAVDRRLRVGTLEPGRIHRATSMEHFPGGKAAHVAMVAKALGARPVWLGFLGGRVGDEFTDEFRKLKIEMSALRTRARTRMNLEMIEASGRITELLEPGERLAPEELRALLRTLERGLRGKWRGAVAVISGSLPQGVSPSFYRALIATVKNAGGRVLVDTSGQALDASLRARPFFVKPNLEEAEALIGRKLGNRKSFVSTLRRFIQTGAESAAITLGSKGLVWIERRNGAVWFARPPRIQATSTVGSGDATVAGFAVAASRGVQGEDAIRLATACGAANCLAKAPGHVSLRDVKRLARRVEIRQIA
jgi:1-phosphofructokinase family hexose kinase